MFIHILLLKLPVHKIYMEKVSFQKYIKFVLFFFSSGEFIS